MFWPGNLLSTQRFLKLDLLRRLALVPTLLRPTTLGVWPLTLPAFVSEPCVATPRGRGVCIYVFRTVFGGMGPARASRRAPAGGPPEHIYQNPPGGPVALTRKRTLVLKRMDENELEELIEKKKTGPFRSLLSRPKRSEVSVKSVSLEYELTVRVSGRYRAAYYRSAVHTLSVDGNVDEVVFGGVTFPSRRGAGIGRLSVGRRADIPLEERVSVSEKGARHFAPDGAEVGFAHDTGAGDIEHYPKKVLAANAHTPDSQIPPDKDAERMLRDALRPEMEKEVRDLQEETSVSEISMIYAPVYTVSLAGPDRRTASFKIDGVGGSVL